MARRRAAESSLAERSSLVEGDGEMSAGTGAVQQQQQQQKKGTVTESNNWQDGNKTGAKRTSQPARRQRRIPTRRQNDTNMLLHNALCGKGDVGWRGNVLKAWMLVGPTHACVVLFSLLPRPRKSWLIRCQELPSSYRRATRSRMWLKMRGSLYRIVGVGPEQPAKRIYLISLHLRSNQSGI